MARLLAVAHVVLALVAFGIGNAGLGGTWDRPGLLHLVFGVVLLATAAALWFGQPIAKALTAVTLGVGALVVLTLAFDSVEGVTPAAPTLMAGAIGFVVIELFSLKQAAEFRSTSGGEP